MRHRQPLVSLLATGGHTEGRKPILAIHRPLAGTSSLHAHLPRRFSPAFLRSRRWSLALSSTVEQFAYTLRTPRVTHQCPPHAASSSPGFPCFRSSSAVCLHPGHTLPRDFAGTRMRPSWSRGRRRTCSWRRKCRRRRRSRHQRTLRRQLPFRQFTPRARALPTRILLGAPAAPRRFYSFPLRTRFYRLPRQRRP